MFVKTGKIGCELFLKRFPIRLGELAILDKATLVKASKDSFPSDLIKYVSFEFIGLNVMKVHVHFLFHRKNYLNPYKCEMSRAN